MKEVYRFTKEEKEAVSKAEASLARLCQIMAENKSDVFEENTGITLDVNSIFVINEHLQTLCNKDSKLYIEKDSQSVG